MNVLKQWETTCLGNWQYKYYKGLGTSTKTDAIEYFSDFYNKLINYVDDGHDHSENEQEDDDTTDLEVNKICHFKAKYKDACTEAITLGFEKTRADHRKLWLKHGDKDAFLDNS